MFLFDVAVFYTCFDMQVTLHFYTFMLVGRGSYASRVFVLKLPAVPCCVTLHLMALLCGNVLLSLIISYF